MSLISKAIMDDDSAAVTRAIENGCSLRDNHMILAAANGCDSIIDILVANGISVNVIGDYGNTPLIYASMGDLPCTVQTLLKHGADVNQTNQSGRNAYWFACDVQSVRVANLLRSAGGQSVPDSTGVYPKEFKRNPYNQSRRRS